MLLWPNEVSTIPNSAAYLLGLKAKVPYKGGYIKGEFCGVYSEPFDMVLGNDLVSYIYRRELNSNAPNPDGIDSSEQWIGFSEGPDCILVSLKLGYETMDRKALDFLASYRWKGQNDFSTVYAWSTDERRRAHADRHRRGPLPDRGPGQPAPGRRIGPSRPEPSIRIGAMPRMSGCKRSIGRADGRGQDRVVEPDRSQGPRAARAAAHLTIVRALCMGKMMPSKICEEL